MTPEQEARKLLKELQACLSTETGKTRVRCRTPEIEKIVRERLGPHKVGQVTFLPPLDVARPK